MNFLLDPRGKRKTQLVFLSVNIASFKRALEVSSLTGCYSINLWVMFENVSDTFSAEIST